MSKGMFVICAPICLCPPSGTRKVSIYPSLSILTLAVRKPLIQAAADAQLTLPISVANSDSSTRFGQPRLNCGVSRFEDAVSHESVRNDIRNFLMYKLQRDWVLLISAVRLLAHS
jgi:hypothetical protein